MKKERGDVLRAEMKRAILSRAFCVSVLLGVAAQLPGLYHYFSGWSRQIANLAPFIYNAYEGWLSAYSYGLMPVAVALLVTLPAAASYLQDSNTGYLNFILLRGSRSAYMRAKLLSNFLAGGLAVLIPLVVLFLFTCIVLPIGLPKQLNVAEVGAFARLLRPSPLLYIAILSVVGFLFGGVYATLALSLSAVSKSRYVVMAAPFVIFQIAHFGLSILGLEQWSPPIVLVPYAITNTSWVTILGGLAVPLLVSLCLLGYLWRREFAGG
jgi:hypothetical protein